nr:unnamed protein product [Spirometra erinaceieuropaei]
MRFRSYCPCVGKIGAFSAVIVCVVGSDDIAVDVAAVVASLVDDVVDDGDDDAHYDGNDCGDYVDDRKDYDGDVYDNDINQCENDGDDDHVNAAGAVPFGLSLVDGNDDGAGHNRR